MGKMNQQPSPPKQQQQDEQFPRVVSSYYYGRPSPFLSNLLFMLNPAPDNLTASSILSVIEFGLGISFFKLGQRMKFAKTFSSRFKRISSYALSGHLLFCGGAQFLSNELNGDDTILAADAKRQRLKAYAENKPVNWWFGPKNYEYMSTAEIAHLLNRAKLQTVSILTMEGSKILLKGEALSKENDVYLHDTIIPMLKNQRGVITTEKPDLTLQNLNLKDDFQHIWFDLFDPWKELWQEVNLSINFVPKWNFIESDADTEDKIEDGVEDEHL